MVGRLEWKYIGKLSTPFQYFSTPYACPRSDLMDKHMSGFRLFSGRTDERGAFRSPPLLGWHQHCNFQNVWTQEFQRYFFMIPTRGRKQERIPVSCIFIIIVVRRNSFAEFCAIALLNFVCGGFLASHGKKKLCHNV